MKQDQFKAKVNNLKADVKAALDSLSRITNHDYSPHQAACLNAAESQLKRAVNNLASLAKALES